mgnify:CR=1 FL=1
MQKDIHPDSRAVIFRDSGAGVDFIAWSTLTSDKTEKVDGVEYPVIIIDVSSASHPFFTGKQKLSKSGRVDKFRQKMEKLQAA